MLNRLTDFRNSVALAYRLIGAAHAKDGTGAFTWPQSDREFVVEAAFLKAFIAWETIQEEVFVDYLVGMPSASGNTMTRYGQPLDRAHANRLLIGIGRFADWSTPDTVRKLANNFLQNGEPFERILSSSHSDLIDLKTIRNAAAHVSSSTTQQLDGLASRRLGRNVSGITVADFLLAMDPASPASATIFDSCVLTLDSAAHGIVHA